MWVRGLKHACCIATLHDIKSHPVWVRGLKLVYTPRCRHQVKSHPVWVRGLKHDGVSYDQFYNVSHPVWVRGLKPTFARNRVQVSTVAPRVGAWIETANFAIAYFCLLCRTPCGCVD